MAINPSPKHACLSLSLLTSNKRIKFTLLYPKGPVGLLSNDTVSSIAHHTQD